MAINNQSSQLAKKNSTLHVSGSYFILGRPKALFEPSNTDQAPSLNHGYKKLSVISSPELVCKRNTRRKRRNGNKIVQDEKNKGNKKTLPEAIIQNKIINIVTADRNNKSKETQQNYQQMLKRKIKG